MRYFSRKVRTIGGVTIASSALIQGCESGTDVSPLDVDDVKIVAHRGAMSERPENTIAAFDRAAEVGAAMVELDLRTSSDGHIVVMHDRTLDRTTDGEGEVRDHTLEELKQLDAGGWFDPLYAGEPIPTLKEVLEWAQEEDMQLLLHPKESRRSYREKIGLDVREANMEEEVVVGVESPEQVRQYGEVLPSSRILAFMGSLEDIDGFVQAGADVMRLRRPWLRDDPGLVSEVRGAGRILMISGDEGGYAEAREIVEHQPDWIMVDNPAQLRLSLDKLEVGIK